MDIFKIERYGEAQNCSQEENLSKLKLKIEERKKRLSLGLKNDLKKGKTEEVNKITNEDFDRSVIEKQTPKKKKKRKQTDNDEENLSEKLSEDINILEKNEIIDYSIRKKKKKKLVNNDFHDEGKLINTDVNLNNVTSNKKTEDNPDIDKSSETFSEIDKVGIEVETPKQPFVKNEDRLFPILGKHRHVKLASVKRMLPKWLAEPTTINSSIELGKIQITDSLNYLSTNTRENLKASDIEYLFPVQASLIPFVKKQSKLSLIQRFPPRDVCVEAPTGSGKTLSYALPIIECLSCNITREIYCLVVLPSKDLAMQVKQVFDVYTRGTKLRAALVCGVKTFEKEKSQLVSKGCGGYVRKVDIVVATPGRLVDHLKSTKGFSLQHLRFLVIDEADRLLGQDYSGWLSSVLNNVHSHGRKVIHPLTASTFQKYIPPLQKMLFSATLTQNPEKLAPLQLFHPILFISQHQQNLPKENADDKNTEMERFIIPEQLSEKIVIVEEGKKPLVVVHLMRSYKRVLCFTKSVQATHRLHLLVSSFDAIKCAEFSSNLTETQRKAIIRDFKKGLLDVVISSDAMARGMDIDKVNLVINYDPPANAKTYVHRVGRTARAGCKGEAITILTSKEVYHFKKMSKKLSGKTLAKVKISNEQLSIFEEKYEKSLIDLREKITLEKRKM